MIFTKLFQEYQCGTWNQLVDEQMRTAVRTILRQRNLNNSNKFVFEKYLRTLITV